MSESRPAIIDAGRPSWRALPMTPDSLRRWRLSLGLTQSEAAQRLHVSRRAVQNWEAGAGSPSHRPPPAWLGLACAAVIANLEPVE